MRKQIKLMKLDEKATMPKFAKQGGSGFDMYTLEDTIIKGGETKLIKTGISIEIPENYAGLIYARSGLATKKGLAPANKVGVIDSDYRGEIMVALHNHSSETQTIDKNERIAQLVVTPFLKVEFNEVDTLTDTVRGAGGFGSTGTK